jgi:four helix bundle protein
MGNFHKMEVWKESKDLAVKIYHVTNQGKFTKDYSFRDQIRRAAINIPSNLAEGEE